MDPSPPSNTSTSASSSPDIATQSPSISRALLQPGLRLPYELWDRVISFLELEPYNLLSCSLVCRTFRELVGVRLYSILSPEICLSSHTETDRLVEEIRYAPSRAMCIRDLFLGRGDPPHGRPIAFSTVPHRLGTQLVNLRIFQLIDLPELTGVHPSTWSLYGRALRGVTSLFLESVRFPSFVDFVRFITSFRALTELDLRGISCAQRGIPPSVSKSPYKRDVRLVFNLFNPCDAERKFAEIFLKWFSTRGGVAHRLNIDNTVTSGPFGYRLLQVAHTRLQCLYIHFGTKPVRVELPADWWGFFRVFLLEFPELETLILSRMQDYHASYACAIVGRIVRPARRLKVEIRIHSDVFKDCNPDAWHTLDVILFGLHCRTLVHTTFESTKDERETLFPLVSAF